MANKIIFGDKIIKNGKNKFLKFLNMNNFLFVKEELNNIINKGPKPIDIIKKYLKNTSKEYLGILC
tara:strand:- start:129 stop:326 length:198 start_codon:yes stop_codon:yes gene_type:complete